MSLQEVIENKKRGHQAALEQALKTADELVTSLKLPEMVDEFTDLISQNFPGRVIEVAKGRHTIPQKDKFLNDFAISFVTARIHLQMNKNVTIQPGKVKAITEQPHHNYIITTSFENDAERGIVRIPDAGTFWIRGSIAHLSLNLGVGYHLGGPPEGQLYFNVFISNKNAEIDNLWRQKDISPPKTEDFETTLAQVYIDVENFLKRFPLGHWYPSGEWQELIKKTKP